MDDRKRVLSVGEWMVTLLLLYIPIINIIAFFIFLFGENETKRNYVLAHLMFFVLGFILVSVLYFQHSVK